MAVTKEMVNFNHWKKVAARMNIKARWPDEIAWRTGSGPRVVGFRPLLYTEQQIFKSNLDKPTLG